MTPEPTAIVADPPREPVDPPAMEGWRAVRAAPGREAQAALAALRAGAWAEAPACVKRDGLKATHLGALRTSGGCVMVALKLRPRGRFAAIKGSQLSRQRRGADRLRAADVTAAAPIALLRETHAPRREALLLARLAGVDLIHILSSGAADEAALRTCARNAGALARQIAGARLLFRDMKLSNIILGEDNRLGLVDTVGVRRIGFGSRARRRAIERMLLAMLKEAAGTRLLPTRAQRMRCLRAALGEAASKQALHASWRRLEAALARAGDTTPRVDPRARPA